MSTPTTSFLGTIKNAFLTFVTDGVAVLGKVLPFLAPFLPTNIVAALQTGQADLTAIATIITGVEATAANMGTAATSSAKLAAAVPGVTQIVTTWLSSGLPGGAKVQNQAGFTQGVSDLVSAMVTILNSVGD